MSPNYAAWGGSEVCQGGNELDLFLEIICMEGHIFTFDLILSGSMCHIEGSCIH